MLPGSSIADIREIIEMFANGTLPTLVTIKESCSVFSSYR